MRKSTATSITALLPKKIRFSTQSPRTQLRNIPVIEESRDRQKSCEQLRRHTTRDELVNPKEGTFRYIPQCELKSFLSHPVKAAIFLRDWCIPFFQDNSIQECLDMINDLEGVHPNVERDTMAGILLIGVIYASAR